MLYERWTGAFAPRAVTMEGKGKQCKEEFRCTVADTNSCIKVKFGDLLSYVVNSSDVLTLSATISIPWISMRNDCCQH